jgi:hypothetical protein
MSLTSHSGTFEVNDAGFSSQQPKLFICKENLEKGTTECVLRTDKQLSFHS